MSKPSFKHFLNDFTYKGEHICIRDMLPDEKKYVKIYIDRFLLDDDVSYLVAPMNTRVVHTMIIKILYILLFEKNKTIVANSDIISRVYEMAETVDEKYRPFQLIQYGRFINYGSTTDKLVNENNLTKIIETNTFLKSPEEYDYYFEGRDWDTSYDTLFKYIKDKKNIKIYNNIEYAHPELPGKTLHVYLPDLFNDKQIDEYFERLDYIIYYHNTSLLLNEMLCVDINNPKVNPNVVEFMKYQQCRMTPQEFLDEEVSIARKE